MDFLMYNSRTKNIRGDYLYLVHPEEYKKIKGNTNLEIGILYEPKSGDLNELKKFDCVVVGKSSNEKILRKLIEHKKVYGVTGIETDKGREHTHYRRSNMNQVIAKMIKDNGKVYVLDFKYLLNSKNRGKLIGRILQNTKFLNKYRCKTGIATFAEDVYGTRLEDNLKALGRVLGMKKLAKFEEKSNLPKGVRILDF